MHQRSGLALALAGTAPRRELTHEGPGALPDFHESFGFEVAVCLDDGRGVDAQLRGELAHGRQGGRRAQLARGDGDSDTRRDLSIEGSGTARIDTFEQWRLAVLL